MITLRVKCVSIEGDFVAFRIYPKGPYFSFRAQGHDFVIGEFYHLPFQREVIPGDKLINEAGTTGMLVRQGVGFNILVTKHTLYYTNAQTIDSIMELWSLCSM